jgi:hypothetical protein
MNKFDFEKYERIKRLNNSRAYFDLILVCSVLGFLLTIGNLKLNIIYVFFIAITIILKEITKVKIKNLDKEKFKGK